MNESFHIWVSHVTHEGAIPWIIAYLRISHVAYKWVMSHMNESCHIWMSHVTYEWVMSHMNESCHIWMNHVTYEGAIQWIIAYLHILQHPATHCNTPQLHHTAAYCSTLRCTATQYNTHQHNATHCHTLSHTATHYDTLQPTALREPYIPFYFRKWKLKIEKWQSRHDRFSANRSLIPTHNTVQRTTTPCNVL